MLTLGIQPPCCEEAQAIHGGPCRKDLRPQPPELKGEQELVSRGERERGFQETEGTTCAKAQGQEKARHIWAAPRGVGWVEHIMEAKGNGEVRSQKPSRGWLR